jgi:uncharacterized membrane protein
MSVLIAGMVLFLGIHSIRIVAEGWRARMIARLGAGPWKGLYSVVAGIGLGLAIWGFGLARHDATLLWTPIAGAAHLVGAVMLLVFMLLAAAYVPGNHLARWVGHPMVLSVVLWSGAHLLANGTDVDLIFFGGFFVWALLDFIVARRREPAAGMGRRLSLASDAIVVVIGIAAWIAFAFYIHGWMTGIKPFG